MCKTAEFDWERMSSSIMQIFNRSQHVEVSGVLSSTRFPTWVDLPPHLFIFYTIQAGVSTRDITSFSLMMITVSFGTFLTWLLVLWWQTLSINVAKTKESVVDSGTPLVISQTVSHMWEQQGSPFCVGLVLFGMSYLSFLLPAIS